MINSIDARRFRTEFRFPDFGRLSVLAVLAAGLVACQPEGPPALSLEEARKVTASFEGQAFAPPPRTIDDVMARINAEQPRDLEAIEKARRDARKEPPAGADRATLAAFYHWRAEQARIAGDPQQNLRDLQEAARLSVGLSEEHNVLYDLGIAYAFLGRHRESVRIIRLSIEKKPEGNLGIPVIRNALLAISTAYTGDLLGAEAALREAETHLVFARQSRAWPNFGPRIVFMVDRARGAMATLRGEYADGERHFRVALADLQDAQINPKRGAFIRASTRSQLGENLALQGRVVEGEVEARKAIKDIVTSNGRYAPEVPVILSRFINVLNAQGRFADAQRVAEAMIDIYVRIGAPRNSLKFALARSLQADALTLEGRWESAAKIYRAIEDALGDPELGAQILGGNLNRPIAFLKLARSDAALAYARLALERYNALGLKHYNAAEANAVLAMALAANGKTAEARAAFEQSIPILLQRSRRTADESTSQAAQDVRLRLILEDYLALLGRIGDDRAAEEAFRIAQAAGGHTVQRALSASAARAAAKDPALASLVRQEQDTLKRIGALNGLLANAVAAGEVASAAMTDLRTRIDTLRAARAALAEEIERRFPDYASLMDPKPAAVAQARAALRPGEALVATYVADSRTYVWAARRTGKLAFAAVPLGREKIAAAVRQLRRALDPRAATLGDIPPFDVALAHRLYRDLLAPVEAGWRDAESLFVVAHRELGQLPLSVLVREPAAPAAEKEPLFAGYREVPFLARSHAVTMLPSVAALATLRGLPRPAAGRRNFAGFGDPLFSPDQARADAAPAAETRTAAVASRGLLKVRGLPVRLRAAPKLDGVSSADLANLPRLPDTADEVRSIALAMNADLTRDVFTGRQASEKMVKTAKLSGYKVLAFATHGLVPGDLDGLAQPALALSAPSVVGGREDGLLTMGEILGLRLDADWVVLSACNTASGEGAGAEAVSGLGRAFFYAGTRALLVSNWPVETTSARALTTDIFRRQAADATIARAEALRRSMLALIDGPGHVDGAGRTVFSYAHPIFWAPFSLVGDGGAEAVRAAQAGGAG